MVFLEKIRKHLFLNAMAALISFPLIGAPITTGIYDLHNHPDAGEAPPGYGLRLDELVNATSGHDIFTFDFDHASSAMFMNYDGSSFHIYGEAFGGLDIGGSYDPSLSGLFAIDFTYTDVASAPGDDDLISDANNPFLDDGTITHILTGTEFDLYEESNGDFSFRFGDENDDLGHRGYDGLSGWGWMNHTDPNTHIYASDWLFTATHQGVAIPEPETYLTLGVFLCFAAVQAKRKKRLLAQAA
jgi:hypothetical protein